MGKDERQETERAAIVRAAKATIDRLERAAADGYQVHEALKAQRERLAEWEAK